MRIKTAIFLFAALALLACNPSRRLAPGQYLINRNEIKGTSNALAEDLAPIIKQKPNRKLLSLAVPEIRTRQKTFHRKQLLSLRFNLFLHNLGSRGKAEGKPVFWYKFKGWLRSGIGEDPVVLDTLLSRKSARQMTLYLQKNGYFNAVVRDSVSLTYKSPKKREVDVFYLVDTGTPYTIDSIFYRSQDSTVLQKVRKDSLSSYLKKGVKYDEGLLQNDRERISRLLKNDGYYRFSREFVHFEVDSSSARGNKVNIYEYIDRVNENSPGNPPENHRQYTVDKVSVEMDFDPRLSEQPVKDTLEQGGYHFIYSPPRPAFTPSSLTRNLFIRAGESYRIGHVEDTQQRLNQLALFRSINIRFEETDSIKGRLDALVQLTPLPRQSFTIENELTHNSGVGIGLGNLGVGGSTNYRNKNLFGGGEQLELRVKGGLEAQTSSPRADAGSGNTLFLFNTVEIGPELNLTIYKFLVPFRMGTISKKAHPVTTISTGYNYQLRAGFYKRTITNLSLNYSWKETAYKRHIIAPFEINGVKIDKTDSLETILATINDRFLLSTYNSHLTTASRYTFVYNTQDLGFKRNVFLFTANIEFAGNTISYFNKLANAIENETGNYLFFGLPYAQYAKTDLDFRYYKNIDQLNAAAFRIATGIGLPYGNSDVLPFEKSFFAGGVNDIRAWPFRRLGPGSYSTSLPLDQSGDIKLVGNAEYRFNIIRLLPTIRLQGAAFADAGNVWTLRSDTNRPGAEFERDRFYREIAVAGGLGARFNFGFFILRLDYAVKLRDPSLKEDSRWIRNASLKNGIFNFGIGYPF